MKKSQIINKIVHLQSMGWCIIKETKEGIVYTHLDTDRVYTVSNATTNTRSIKTNASMWKYLSLLAEQLNNAGFSIQKMMKIELSWSKDTVKQFLWDAIMKAITNKTSSTKLTSSELTEIHKYLDLKMQEKGLEHIPFPNIKSMMMDKWCKEN